MRGRAMMLWCNPKAASSSALIVTAAKSVPRIGASMIGSPTSTLVRNNSAQTEERLNNAAPSTAKASAPQADVEDARVSTCIVMAQAPRFIRM